MLAVMYGFPQADFISWQAARSQRGGGGGAQGVFAVFLPKLPHLTWQCLVNESLGRRRKKAGLCVKILLDIK